MLRILFRMILTGAIVAAVLFTTLYLLPQEYYKTAISWLVYKQTGSQFTINGDIEFTPFSDDAMALNNAEFIQTPDEHARLALNFGRIAFRRSGLFLDNVVLHETNARYTDTLTGSDIALDAINATIKIPVQDPALTVRGDLQYKGQKVNYDAVIDNPEAINKGKKSGVRANVHTAFAAVSYQGQHARDSREGKVSVQMASLRNLASWLTGNDRVDGSGVMEATFSMRNNDIATLNGSAAITLNDIVQNYSSPVLKRLMTQITGSVTDDIKQVSATFDIRNGVIINRDLAGQGPTAFRGEGQIDLVRQTIDYRITPEVALSTVKDVPKISPPVTIKGPLLSPTITVEAKDIVKEVVKKPEQVIKAVTDVMEDNAEGKQIKEDLQDLRDRVLKDPQLQQELLNNLLGGTSPPAQ